MCSFIPLAILKMDAATRSRRYRSLLSEQQKAEIRQKDRERRAAARALLSEEQKDLIRQQSRERQRAARQRERDLNRSHRLATDITRQKHRCLGQSVEQR